LYIFLILFIIKLSDKHIKNKNVSEDYSEINWKV